MAARRCDGEAMSKSKKIAVCLLSGGLDSTTSLAIAKAQGFEVCAISFRYGQRHVVELECATTIAKQLGVSNHLIVDIDLRKMGGSALTADIEVPKDRPVADMSHGIPVTYVPARNTIFLSYALAWAEVLGATDIFIGVNALDYSGYPDCRPEYIAAFETMANLATKRGVEAGAENSARLKIHTPSSAPATAKQEPAAPNASTTASAGCRHSSIPARSSIPTYRSTPPPPILTWRAFPANCAKVCACTRSPPSATREK